MKFYMHGNAGLESSWFNCILGVMACILLNACSDILESEKSSFEEKPTFIQLSLNIEPEQNGFRCRSVTDVVNEGTVGNHSIKDVWLLEYTDNGVLVGSPQYIELPKTAGSTGSSTSVGMNVILPEGEIKYKVAVIANTHLPNLDIRLKNATTMESLASICKNFYEEKDAYYEFEGAEPCDMMFNGVAEIGSNSASIKCDLYRNVAKLSLKITNDPNSGVEIKSVQLKNVPDKISYADQLLNGAVPQGTVFFSLPKENWEEGSTSMDFTYYIPSNNQPDGDLSNQLESQKNKFAPQDATYVEITGVSKPGKMPVTYKFYPGKDMKSNFQILGNHHYILPVTITNIGDPLTDCRVETFPDIRFGSSNSYIVNYLGKGSAPTYSIPIDRINVFWENTEKKDPNCVIKSDSEWIAEVVWQDVNTDLFEFIDDKGEECSNHIYRGKGVSRFRVRPTGNCSGNVVIGVRNKDNPASYGYSWSWHLWITDYDPSYEGPHVDNRHVFGVSGGNVYNFGTNFWTENYTGKYIMDRNFGAHRATNTSLNPASYEGYGQITGVLYFFGRKDPFIYQNETMSNQVFKLFKYDNGSLVSTSYSYENKAASIEESVKYPATIYSDASLKWNDSSYATWLRQSWVLTDTDETDKSLYDPCPYGWKIPESEIWWKTTADMAMINPSSNKDGGLYIRFADNESEEIFLPITRYGIPDMKLNKLSPATSNDYANSMILHININNTNFNTEFLAPNIKLGEGQYDYVKNLNFYRNRALPIRMIRK